MPKKQPGVPKEPKKAKGVTVTLGDSRADFQGKVNIQKSLRTAAPQSPKINPAITAALNTWSKDTDQAVTVYASIIDQEKALEQSYGQLGNLLLQMGLDRQAFITAVQGVCVNDADAKSFGCNQRVRSPHVEPVAPAAIRQIDTGVVGTDKIRWPSEPGAASYMAEVSTADPPTPTSWAGCYTGMSPFFTYTGPPGQRVWFRICSVGKAPSAWSTPFMVILR
jgi:hypothetical protein